MILQGTDGISRGELNQGVAIGKAMLDHCPWARSAILSSPSLIDTIKAWVGGKVRFLNPVDWYEAGHDIIGWKSDHSILKHPIIKEGTYVWSPSPAAADACLEQLQIVRGKRKRSFHIVVIPKLMTPL